MNSVLMITSHLLPALLLVGSCLQKSSSSKAGLTQSEKRQESLSQVVARKVDSLSVGGEWVFDIHKNEPVKTSDPNRQILAQWAGPHGYGNDPQVIFEFSAPHRIWKATSLHNSTLSFTRKFNSAQVGILFVETLRDTLLASAKANQKSWFFQNFNELEPPLQDPCKKLLQALRTSDSPFPLMSLYTNSHYDFHHFVPRSNAWHRLECAALSDRTLERDETRPQLRLSRPSSFQETGYLHGLFETTAISKDGQAHISVDIEPTSFAFPVPGKLLSRPRLLKSGLIGFLTETEGGSWEWMRFAVENQKRNTEIDSVDKNKLRNLEPVYAPEFELVSKNSAQWRAAALSLCNATEGYNCTPQKGTTIDGWTSHRLNVNHADGHTFFLEDREEEDFDIELIVSPLSLDEIKKHSSLLQSLLFLNGDLKVKTCGGTHLNTSLRVNSGQGDSTALKKLYERFLAWIISRPALYHGVLRERSGFSSIIPEVALLPWEDLLKLLKKDGHKRPVRFVETNDDQEHVELRANRAATAIEEWIEAVQFVEQEVWPQVLSNKPVLYDGSGVHEFLLHQKGNSLKPAEAIDWLRENGIEPGNYPLISRQIETSNCP